jgi:hypothetical protein
MSYKTLKVDRNGEHQVKWNKPDPQRKVSHLLSHLWKQRGGGTKQSKIKLPRPQK